MQTTDIVRRAFELAPECADRLALERALTREGYTRVQEHLASRTLRKELLKLYAGTTAEGAEILQHRAREI